MDLRQLKSFVAVVEEGSFARGAQRLFLSPPAVTAHVKALEREVGARLLERSPLELTDSGRRLMTCARTLLETERRALQVADAPADDEVLRVGVMGHGSAELTPATIAAFARAKPDVTVRLVPLSFQEHVTALVERRVDVAFVRPAPVDERIVSDVMTTESRILVTSRRSELAAAASVSVEEVLDLRYVDIPAGSPREFADFMYFGRARNGDPVRRSDDVTFTPHDVLLSAALARGVGSSVQSFRRFYSWPGVAFVPIRDAPVEQTVLASRATDRRPVVAAFRSIATTLASTVNAVDGRFCSPRA
ncbi:LysR family transcriptional regulator [Pseudonocardia alaniniphila]|uniref:LysR family transcriptional regulator n=1 Tax=Pseudonocardia alaniniphila TaxID=75291 RepID=A0ABS9TEF6_9PSEU|nr:LysR family transcriptional regulator [Pseudonocardia alaniniphila]MCH6166925.1 LysR family transcriptional regulator [Pseudonocardia alaniniphila]